MKSEQVIDIRKRYYAGEGPTSIGRDYGISRSAAYRAATGRTYWRVGNEPILAAFDIARQYIKGNGLQMDTYGTCIVDDPRCFTPDPECSEFGERYAWAEAVQRVNNGEDVGNPGYGGWSDDLRGWVVRTPWGYGTNWIAS